MNKSSRKLLLALCLFACVLAIAMTLPRADVVPPRDVQTPVRATVSHESGADSQKKGESSDGAPSPAPSPEKTSVPVDEKVQPSPDDEAIAPGVEGEEPVEQPEGDVQQDNHPVFVMPEGAEYEPKSTVVEVASDVDLQGLEQTLSESLGGATVERISDTYVRVQYDAETSVEDAVNTIMDSGYVETAQPNYTYHVLEDSTSLVDKLGASLNKQSDDSTTKPSDKDKHAKEKKKKSANPSDQEEADDSEQQTKEASDAEAASVNEPETPSSTEASNGEAEKNETDAATSDTDSAAEGTSGQEGTADGQTPAAGEEAQQAEPETSSDAQQGSNASDTGQDAQPSSASAQEDAARAAAEKAAREERAAEQRREEARAEEEARVAAQSEGSKTSEASKTSKDVKATQSTPAEQKAQDVQDEAGLESLAEKINDPRAKSQWALSSINAYEAWSYAKTNHRVTVAAMDLGFQLDHADLKANVVDPYNAYNALHGGSTADVSPFNRGDDHGTHVAGIIGAVSNNGVGVSGVSYNANIMPIKVVSGAGTASTAEIVKAYDYVMGKSSSRNVRVINLSMGADIRKLGNTDMSFSADDAVLSKIKQAYNKGIVTVAAAGNRSSSQTWSVPYSCYPSDSDYVVSVINLQQSGSGVSIADGSNYNASGERKKNISAPGTSILSTVWSHSYGTKSGTSMAAPVVSGVLALVFSAKPSLSSSAAVNLLYSTAKDLGGADWTSKYGWGEVDAAAAVKVALGKEAAKKSSSESASSESSTTPAKKNSVSYRSHVQRIGWQAWKSNGLSSGTTGQSLRLEGVQIKLASAAYSGAIQYRTHVQSYGWESSWRSNGATSGTVGQAKRLEAIQIRLTGQMAQHYDVWYRVHAQRFGWLGWAKNGASSGTAGYSYRLESLQIKLLPKGSSAPGSTSAPFRFGVHYSTHVQRYGWQDAVHDGTSSGTTGQSLRLEAIKINVGGVPYSGAIQYRTHVQTYGWQGWVSNNQMSGTSGQSKRLEAICIRLTGDLATRYDVYYRVHAQRFGWMGWAKNGASAGTAGYSYRLEAIQIRLVAKGSSAPGSTANAFRSR